MEFKPINTEEEFAAAVKDKYGDVEDLQGKITTHESTIAARDKTIAELQGKVKGYETTALKQKVAKEKGIPLDMASRLTGDDEKSLKADADIMAANLRAYKGAAPLAEPGPAAEDGKRAGLRNLLRGMKGE